jgi:hypothetical protein
MQQAERDGLYGTILGTQHEAAVQPLQEWVDGARIDTLSHPLRDTPKASKGAFPDRQTDRLRHSTPGTGGPDLPSVGKVT